MPSTTVASLGVTNGIDTHLHPWRLSNLPPVIQGAKEVRPDLAQDYSPSRVITSAKESGFSGVIFAQARDPHEGSTAEAQFFLEAAREHPEVLGCIVGIDLLDTEGTRLALSKICDNPIVRSGRMLKPENFGVGILSDERAQGTIKLLGEMGLSFDLLIRSANRGQLEEGVRLVQWLSKNAKTTVIGDHLLKPTGVAEGKTTTDWRDALRELAECGNFYLKISGLPGEVPRGTSPEKFYSFYDAALEILGADHLLFGSDHPVSFEYGASVLAVVSWIEAAGIGSGDIPQKIFGDNARVAYRIG